VLRNFHCPLWTMGLPGGMLQHLCRVFFCGFNWRLIDLIRDLCYHTITHLSLPTVCRLVAYRSDLPYLWSGRFLFLPINSSGPHRIQGRCRRSGKMLPLSIQTNRPSILRSRLIMIGPRDPQLYHHVRTGQ